MTVLDGGGISALPSNYALNDILEVLPEDTSTFSPSTPSIPFRPFPGERLSAGEGVLPCRVWGGGERKVQYYYCSDHNDHNFLLEL